MNQTVRHREEVLVPPAGPFDILARRIDAGTKAPAHNGSALPSPAEVPLVELEATGKRARPKAPRAAPAEPQPTPEIRIRKPPREWKPKERK